METEPLNDSSGQNETSADIDVTQFSSRVVELKVQLTLKLITGKQVSNVLFATIQECNRGLAENLDHPIDSPTPDGFIDFEVEVMSNLTS